MISEALRTDIQVWASKADKMPLFQFARAGRLTAEMVTRYIANVTHMIRLTPGHLRLARDRARFAGDQTLAAHYEHKIAEEVGHDAWGDADLASLGLLVAAPSNTTALPSIEALARSITAMIEADPALYLTYLAFTEYVTVLLGPGLLASIDTECGIPRTSMTVIDKHIELDRDHAEEGFGIIDELVGDPRKIGAMRAALAGIFGYFDAFAVEITIDDAAEESRRDVSAA